MNFRIRINSLSNLVSVTAVLGCVCLAAGTASARTEVLRWTHSDSGTVIRFDALIGPTSDTTNRVENLGLPAQDGSGVFSASIVVGDSEDVFVALVAVGTNGLASTPSNQQLRAATTPSPPPVSGVGSSSFDFEQDPVGLVVLGWYDTEADFSLTGNESLFGVATAGLSHILTTSSTLSDIHSHVVPAPETVQNYRLRGSFSFGSDGGGIGITVYSSYPNAASYYRLARNAGGGFAIESQPAGLNCPVDGIVITAGESYQFELEAVTYASQNLIRAKVWRKGDPEPLAMQVQCADGRADRPTGGTIGVWAEGSGAKFWDDFVLEALTTLPPQPAPLAAPTLISVTPVQ